MKRENKIAEIEWELARFTEMILEIYKKIEYIEMRLKKIEQEK